MTTIWTKLCHWPGPRDSFPYKISASQETKRRSLSDDPTEADEAYDICREIEDPAGEVHCLHGRDFIHFQNESATKTRHHKYVGKDFILIPNVYHVLVYTLQYI